MTHTNTSMDELLRDDPPVIRRVVLERLKRIDVMRELLDRASAEGRDYQADLAMLLKQDRMLRDKEDAEIMCRPAF